AVRSGRAEDFGRLPPTFLGAVSRDYQACNFSGVTLPHGSARSNDHARGAGPAHSTRSPPGAGEAAAIVPAANPGSVSVPDVQPATPASRARPVPEPGGERALPRCRARPLPVQSRPPDNEDLPRGRGAARRRGERGPR